MQKTFITLFLFCSIHAFGQGVLYDPADTAFLDSRSYRNITELPPNISLKPYCPPAEAQGTFPTCVSWAAAYYAQTIQRRMKANDVKLPASSPFFLAHFAHRFDKYSKPVSILSVLKQFRRTGTILANNPTVIRDFRKIPTDSLAGKSHCIQNFDFVYDRAKPDRLHGILFLIKAQLKLNHPVILGFETDDTFEGLMRNQIWNPTTATVTENHAVCIIGYDDSKKAFEVANSYGKDWGGNGFGWLSYEAVQKRGLQLFVLQ
jgi:hypothetical protein